MLVAALFSLLLSLGHANAADDSLDQIRSLGYSVSSECDPLILNQSPKNREEVLRRLQQLKESVDNK